MKKTAFARYLIYAAFWAAADLATKYAVFAYLEDKPMRMAKILPFLNAVTVHNSGVSFGMFSSLEYGKEVLLFVACAVSFGMASWLWRTEHRGEATALSLIIGGAIGNIVDRAMNGFVADFIDFHIGNFHWPAFNLADSTIFIGVAMLVWLEYKKSKKPTEEKNASQS